MLVAAAVCPQPPALHPALAAGVVAELAPLRAACDEVVGALVSAKPDTIVAIGATHADEPFSTGLGPYGAEVELSSRSLPLSLLLASYLLDRAGWDGARAFECVAEDEEADACLARGAAIGAETGRVALLVMADGSARRNEKAPGWIDPDAEPFDRIVARALADGDVEALRGLDPDACRRLMVGGRAAWQLLAGAATGVPIDAWLIFNDAPYGVGYFVALWKPRAGANSLIGA